MVKVKFQFLKEKMKKSFFNNWHNVNHYSSTYQDLMSKRKSEIAFFNGTLARLANKHNLNAEENRKIFGDFDPFGDFDLIFGAAKLNLKILEIPIRYRSRTYGNTNIKRFEQAALTSS